LFKKEADNDLVKKIVITILVAQAIVIMLGFGGLMMVMKR
jgi:hypothetical protein